MGTSIVWQISLQVFLILLNAVFACAEIAIISMNDNKLEQMAARGDKRALRLVRLTSQPARFLATIQVAITLSGFMGSAFAAENFSDMLVNWLVELGAPIAPATLDAIAIVVITLILSYFTLVFGELVPKRLAMKKAEPLALGMSSLITMIAKLFAPVVWVLTASTNFMLRLCGIDPNAEDEQVSEEEIRMMVDIGNKKGVIDAEEKEIIENVFEFDDLPIADFVTHRTDMSMLWVDETQEQWDKTICESRYTLYPVCDKTVDCVVGILSTKEYFRLAEKTRDAVLKHALKPVFFVPENICADVLFRQMKKTRNRIAVVVDEYGGVTGIITMNDLLEQLVGDFDEAQPDEAQPRLLKMEDGTWQIHGGASLDRVAHALGVTLPTDEYDTFGGFVFAQHGFIPPDGAQLVIDVCGLHICVEQVQEHRLVRAVVSIVKQD